jgi:hypothetical protein
MKSRKTNTALFAMAIFALFTLVLAGCSVPLLEKPQEASASDIPEGFGSIRVSFTQGAERTVMPEAELDELYLEYQFAKAGGGVVEEKAPVDGKFILEPGNYSLTVNAFADSDRGNLVAEGTTEEDFAIAAGVDAGTVSVALRPETDEGVGSLEFGLQYPAGATVESFTLTRIAGTDSFNLWDAVSEVSGTDPLVVSGTKADIPAGYYLLRVALKDSSGLYAGKSEVTHIYQNLTAQARLADYTFAEQDFSQRRVTIDYTAYATDKDFRQALKDVLQQAFPELNTPGNPVPVKVVGLDISTKLSVLTDALTRYASLDLSECAVSLPETQVGSWSPNGPWGDLDIKESKWVVDLVLPAAVISLPLQSHPLITFTAYSNLRSFTAPGVVRMNDSIFRHCVNLERVELPALKEMYNTSQFADCPSLKTVIIPEAETFGKWAFSNCTALETIEVANVTFVAPLAFEGANPDFDFVVSGPLAWNAELRQLIRADEDAVKLLAWLKDDRDPADIPAHVTEIGDSLFFGMKNIISINLPATITAIGKEVFERCSSLVSALLPGVTKLGVSAFAESGLVEANFPEVTDVGERAFQYCLSLESVNLPKVVTIGDAAFINGSYYEEVQGKLSSVNLGDSLESIGRHAFIYCSKLESLTLPAMVTYIGEQAFGSRCGIKTLTVKAITPPFVESGMFGLFEAGSIETIYVPAGSVAAYKVASGWKEYAELITAIE